MNTPLHCCVVCLFLQGILCSPLFEGKSYKEINLMVARVLEDIGKAEKRAKNVRGSFGPHVSLVVVAVVAKK